MSAFDKWIASLPLGDKVTIEQAFNAGMTLAAEVCGNSDCAQAILKARDGGCAYCNSLEHTLEEHAEALRGTTSTPAPKPFKE